MPIDYADPHDPQYQAGYQQAVLDQSHPPVSNQRRYLFAAGTLIVGIGGALTTLLVANPKTRHIGGLIFFTGATTAAVFGAVHILVDKNPVTPTLRIPL